MNKSIEDYESEYRLLPFEYHQAQLRRQEHLAVLADLKPKRIAEIGCGMLPLFCDYDDFDLMTVGEPAKAFAENASTLRARHVKASAIRVIPHFLEDVQIEDEAYDLVFVSGLLHEVPEPRKILEQAIRLGGRECRFLITVPNAYSFHRQLGYRAGLIEDLTEISAQQLRLQQPRTYTPASLLDELAMAGLVPELKKTFIFKPFTHSQMQKILDAGILSLEQVNVLAGMSDLLPDAGSELLVIAKCK